MAGAPLWHRVQSRSPPSTSTSFPSSRWASPRRERFRRAFLASSLFLASNLAGIAAAAFPTLLRSVDDEASVTAYAAAASPHALRVGAAWVPLRLAAVVTVFVRRYRAVGGRAAK